MTAKIRIKLGQVEVEYEGPEDFLRDELQDLLSAVVELHQANGDADANSSSTTKMEGNAAKAAPPGEYTGTVNTWAAKLGAKSGPDLVIAAMAKLTLVDGLPTVSRATLLSEMKSATSYYKKSYGSNLSVSLKGLVTSDRLREISKDTFALSATEKSSVASRYGS